MGTMKLVTSVTNSTSMFQRMYGFLRVATVQTQQH